jgi:hypothetical protein
MMHKACLFPIRERERERERERGVCMCRGCVVNYLSPP